MRFRTGYPTKNGEAPRNRRNSTKAQHRKSWRELAKANQLHFLSVVLSVVRVRARDVGACKERMKVFMGNTMKITFKHILSLFRCKFEIDVTTTSSMDGRHCASREERKGIRIVLFLPSVVRESHAPPLRKRSLGKRALETSRCNEADTHGGECAKTRSKRGRESTHTLRTQNHRVASYVTDNALENGRIIVFEENVSSAC